uniref:synaptopodin n=1 Tax=Pristiophorus japonicus TaxID=55135 RepID=UPI00398E72DA
MQVGADVRSCGYLARARARSRPRWSTGEAGPPPSITDQRRPHNHLGGWEDQEQCKAGGTGADREHHVSPSGSPSDQRAPCRTEPRVAGELVAPKVVPQVLPAEAAHHRPARLCRSLSASEQETKEARLQSQKIAAQLTTPPGANSKGVLLFNKRKKRVNEFTLTSYGRREPGGRAPVDGDAGAPVDGLAGEPGGSSDSPSSSSEDPGVPYFERRAKGDSMEAEDSAPGETRNCAPEGEEAPHRPAAGGPPEASDLARPARTTMEVRLAASRPPREPDEAYMDLPGDGGEGREAGVAEEEEEEEEKQALVVNRTPKPFLSEGAAPKPYVAPPAVSPCPPVYSNPPPVCRMTSPPPMARSSPPAESPVVWSNKTGLLEESRMRRAARKPMFTFHEKPKVTPNPELLSLVQGIDVKKRSGQAEGLAEEDYLGLGAEACTFAQQKASPPAGSKPEAPSQDGAAAPEWASCLKPPELRAPHRSGATQALAEVKGKGAELFARRQSRMERYTFESSPAAQTRPRAPSPTASLPPSWRCRDESALANRGLRPGPRPQASAFTPPPPPADRAPAEPPRRQQPSHQLSSSLFIIAPDRGPLNALPRAAPSPPRLLLPGAPPYHRQTSAPPAQPRPADKPPAGTNGFGHHSPAADLRGLAGASPGGGATSPRLKEATQAPRPSFSARRAGLEPQGWMSPTTPPWKPSFERRLSSPRMYTGIIRSPPGNECRPCNPGSPFSPVSPPAGVATPNSWSPLRTPKTGSPAQPSAGGSEGRRLKDLLAKNVVSAARRKKLSGPGPGPSPTPGPSSRRRRRRPSPPAPGPPASPRLPPRCCPASPSARSPLRLYRRSLTDSEFSLGSDDSGPRSPSYYNFCPRGWSGSKLRQSDQL